MGDIFGRIRAKRAHWWPKLKLQIFLENGLTDFASVLNIYRGLDSDINFYAKNSQT
jgi:hypothetical protein